MHPLQIALIGNPNTGKTTLFNALTGSNQRVGNYPGVTIAKKTGLLQLGEQTATLLDLPGTYSLSASSPDESVVVDALIGNIEGVQKPDLIVCVIDATHLMRNLFLASQVAELDIPMVIVLNQWDLAKRRDIVIDLERMENALGVPVIPTVASRREGIDTVIDALQESLKKPRCMKKIEWSEPFERAIVYLRTVLEKKYDEPLSDPELRRILFDADSAIANRIQCSREELRTIIEHARKWIREAGLNPYSAEAVLHYRHLHELMRDVVCQGRLCMNPHSESIDRLLTHRVWGLVIFVGMMWFVFQAVYSWAGPLMDGIEYATGWFQGVVAPWFDATPMVQSLVVDGLIGGAGGVVIFLPQILILFFFIGLLEETGYMPRAAFLMDKLFSWCGLNGKSFVPLLSSYACAVPGVLATRTIGDPKARLATILVAPLMSCSARLPVYVLLIGAFVEPYYGSFVAGFALFAMHFVGMIVAIPVTWCMTRFVLHTPPQPFLLEMCCYRVPRMDTLVRRIVEQGKEFLVRAGTVILAFSVIIWALLYFPRPEAVAESVTQEFLAEIQRSLNAQAGTLSDAQTQELERKIESAYIEQSYIGRFGKTVQPVFEYAGFDWKITVGVIASFPAREVIIATLGIIYSLGADESEDSDTLRNRMAAEVWAPGTPRAGTPIFTLPVVFAIMVFFALCMQCGATLAVIARESSWGWAVFCFVYMTTLAWMGAVATYQIGTHLL